MEEAPKEAQKIGVIAGEIHIIANPDGSMNLQYPENFVVAFGILECARVMMISNQLDAQRQANQRAQRQQIVRAGAGALGALDAGKAGLKLS